MQLQKGINVNLFRILWRCGSGPLVSCQRHNGPNKPKVFLLGDCDDRIDDLQEEMKALKGTFANTICELQKDLLLLVEHRLEFEKNFIKIA